MKEHRFQLIALDADDTLWHNETLYTAGRERFLALMAPYRIGPDFEKRLDEIEIQNLRYYGYGVNGFTLSLIQAAIELSDGKLYSAEIQALLDLGKEMLMAEVCLFEHVETTLQRLSAQYPLLLITKGDLLHQQSKVERSGIKSYFQGIEIVSAKDPATYAAILERYGVAPERFVMVGNALRSDILPVLELGGWAVYIPHQHTWSHERVEMPDGEQEHFAELESIAGLPEQIAAWENSD